jgi:hypothetical protein
MWLLLGALGCLSALAACGDRKVANKSNLKSAVQAYLDTQTSACARLPKEPPFTLIIRGATRDSTAQATALVEAGLLTMREKEIEAPGSKQKLAGAEYSITEEGKKHFIKHARGFASSYPAFCSGKYRVTEIDTFTEPSDAMGVRLTKVNFRFTVDGVAPWIKAPSVLRAYANLARDAQAEISDQATLIATNEGWMHEQLFRPKGQ